MGVAGSAWGTVIGQTLSAILNCWYAFARIDIFTSKGNLRREIAWSPSHIRRLCVVGLPMGVEYSISAIGAILMQNALNSLGAALVTAQTAGEKIRQMFTLPMESVGMAMATYAGQNFGARNFKRLRQGLVSGVVIQSIYSLMMWAVIAIFQRPLVEFVIGRSSSKIIISSGIQYLSTISFFFILHGSLMIFRNTLQGGA